MAEVKRNEVAPPKKTAAGIDKGFTWSDLENLALDRGAALACSDPIVGSGMSSAQLARKIRAAFIKDTEKPRQACTLGKYGGPLDERRWDGRSAEACHKRWLKIRRECTKYKGCLDRVIGMELTGNPDEKSLERCADLVYSEGGTATSHLYDVIRNPNYLIRKPFPFMEPFRFLDKKTTLLHAADITDGIKKEEKKVRPTGVKTAKRLKGEDRARKQLGVNGLEQSASDMANAVKRMEDTMIASQVAKNRLAEMNVFLAKRRLDWEMSHELYGPGSDATPEERAQFSRLMRKRLLRSLEEDTAPQDELEVVGTSNAATAGDSSALIFKPTTSAPNTLSTTTVLPIVRTLSEKGDVVVVGNTAKRNCTQADSEWVNETDST